MKEVGEKMQAELLICPIKHHHAYNRCVPCTLRCAILNFLRQYLLETINMLDSWCFLVICTWLSLPFCTCCATDYTVSNGSLALGGYGYATDGGNPFVKVCKFQIASCSSLQEGHGEREEENASGSDTQSHNNFWWLTCNFSHQLLCMFLGS